MKQIFRIAAGACAIAASGCTVDVGTSSSGGSGESHFGNGSTSELCHAITQPGSSIGCVGVSGGYDDCNYAFDGDLGSAATQHAGGQVTYNATGAVPQTNNAVPAQASSAPGVLFYLPEHGALNVTVSTTSNGVVQETMPAAAAYNSDTGTDTGCSGAMAVCDFHRGAPSFIGFNATLPYDGIQATIQFEAVEATSGALPVLELCAR